MKCLVSTLGVIILLVSLSAFAQNQNPEIIVLPQHEENYVKIVTWLKENKSFKGRLDFVNSIQETFKSAKSGDIKGYFHWLGIFKLELAKLGDTEKSELMNFTLSSLKPVKRETKALELPGCEVDCLLTSCRINCPSGTKPKCQCHWFFADCGCEPY